MTQEEAKNFLKTIYNMYQHKPLDNEDVRNEYIKILEKFSLETACEALEGLYKTITRCPYPSDLYNACKDAMQSKQQTPASTGDIKCWVCEDKGAMVMVNNGIATALYCDQCDIGRANAYDGRKLADKKHPSLYYLEPISKYYDVDVLAEQNKGKDRTPVQMPEYAKLALKNAIRKLAMK